MNKQQKNKVYDRKLLFRLLKYLKPYKKKVFSGTILLFLALIFEAAEPIIVKITIDRYITQNPDFNKLIVMGAIFLSVLFLVFITKFAHTFIMGMVGQNVMYDLRKEIFRHYNRLSVRFFDKNPLGKLITRITNDVDALNEMFTTGVIAILGDFLMLFIIICVLIYLNLKLALITFSVIPVLFVVAFIFKKKVRGMFDLIRERLSRINSYLQENISGMKIIQIFNREEENFKRFNDINKSYLDAYLKTIFYYAVFFPVVMLISGIAIALILWYGGSNIIKGTLTFGALVAFIQYAQRFYRPIMDISEKYNIIQSALAASNRIFDVLDTQDFIPEPEREIKTKIEDGKVEFKNVWFKYNNDDFVLKNISFKVNPGESVAIVGATGAGKTSIINLLCRFYDVNKGQILIDDVDIRSMKKSNLRRKISLVLQDAYLFSGSINDNISLGNKEIYEDKIKKAVSDVDAIDFIMRLPNEFKEDVRERGSRLSTGQKQLISFARALAFDPKILILDEATANIDTETEIKIQNSLKKLMKEKTSIVIAHRLSTIKNVNRIIVLHKGEIKEIGNHQELLKKKGIYYRLYQLQFKEQESQTLN